jgi:hypothetical protein
MLRLLFFSFLKKCRDLGAAENRKGKKGRRERGEGEEEEETERERNELRVGREERRDT